MPSRKSLALLFLLVTMELLAGFGVVVGSSSLLDATSLGYTTFWLFLLCGFVGVGIGLAVAAFGPGGTRNRVALVAGGVATAGLTSFFISGDIVSFLAAIVLLVIAYWRGVTVTQEQPSHEEVQRRFGTGFGILFVGIVWVTARGIVYHRAIWQMLALLGIAYIVSAMTALGVARVEEMREPGAIQSIVLAVGVQIVLLLLVSTLTLELFSADIFGWVFRVTRPLWDITGLVTFTFLKIVLTPILGLIDLIRPHAHLAHNPALQPDQTRQQGNPRRLVSRPDNSLWPTIIGFALVWSVLTGIGILVWRSIPSLPRRLPERGYRERRAWLVPPGLLWTMFLAWLRAAFKRSGAGAAHVALDARRRVLGPIYPADNVRRLYARLLYRAAGRGVQRSPSTTPLEFQRSLITHWPAASADVTALTAAYMERRYGAVAAAELADRDLDDRWHRIRADMRKTVREPAPIDTKALAANDATALAPGPVAWQRAAITRVRKELFGEEWERSTSGKFTLDVIASIVAFVVILGIIVGVIVFSLTLLR